MESIEELTDKLTELIATGTRGQLLARGLARGMIWDDGELAPGSPNFSQSLTNDLLNHGYSVLGCALRLRSGDPTSPVLDDSFRTAAESIEAATRRGRRNEERGFHLTVAAAAFHLGHYAARSFSLLAEDRDSLNLSNVERILVSLMQRRLGELEGSCLEWLTDDSSTDEGVANLLANADNDFMPADAARVAVSRLFHQAIASFDFALRTGNSSFVEAAISRLNECIDASEQMRHVPLWWSCNLARHLIDDLWDRSVHVRLPRDANGNEQWEELRSNFIDLLSQRDIAEIDLWPSQLTAAKRVVDETDSLVVALPTSSGKTRIAELCILRCLAGGRRVVYVTPLRALSAQIELTLGRTFLPLGFSVTSVYGASGLGASDVDTMVSADIVVSTPEKLDFAIRQSPEAIDDVGLIVLDEGHMIGLNEREIRYEILVQRLLKRVDSAARRIVCLSAIFTEGEPFDAFTQWIRADHEGEAIQSKWRPTRQRPATLEWQTSVARLEYDVQGEKVFVPGFVEAQNPRGNRRRKLFPKDRLELVVSSIERFQQDGHTVLVYCPLRKSVESVAKSYLTAVKQGYVTSLLAKDAEAELEAALRIGAEWLGDDHVAMQGLRIGIAVHHGQLPRPFLGEIERLLRRRVLHVAISSPTLAQGVDLSFSVLLFNSLWRGRKLIPPKEFANVVGRVGRAYVDLDGIYVLPVHETQAYKKRQRLDEFHRLVQAARVRQLESGLYQLIRLCLGLLEQRYNIPRNKIAEYVLNHQPAIDEMSREDKSEAKLLGVVLAELDAGIFASIENLDCDVADVADKLDEALANSYWQRRLAVRELQERESQLALLRGRVAHVWTRTDQRQRRGFYAASIGTEAGLQIVEQSNALNELLASCTDAIKQGDIHALAAGCSDLARVLFEVYPFQPDSLQSDWGVETWQAILRVWISGLPLSDVTDSTGIAFVQEGLVFRLVWAIEAVRIVLSSLREQETVSEDETFVAICMTYGVPSIAAARILESGMESRLLAVRLVSELGLTFSTRDALMHWLEYTREEEPIPFSDEERVVWRKFVVLNEPRYRTWHRQHDTVRFNLLDEWDVEEGELVRVVSDREGHGDVFKAEFDRLGDLSSSVQPNTSFVGTVLNTSEIELQRFGPMTVPPWLADLIQNE